MKTNVTQMPAMYDGAGGIVSAVGAVDAVKWFAQLWASGLFDCGPHDYEIMVKESIAALEVAVRGMKSYE
jgi:hypothetical protein